MKIRALHAVLAGAALTVLAAAAGAGFAASPFAPVPARAATLVTCPPGQQAEQCLVMSDTGSAHNGQVIMDSPGAHPGTPLLITDSNGAPMAWVNLYGLYSGGDGGKMPGGLICVTYGVSSTPACLTPEGTLTLQATGPNGPTGPVETLTPALIAFDACLMQPGATLGSCRGGSNLR